MPVWPPVQAVAQICHEVNRELTRFGGDVPVQPPWPEAPVDMRASCIKGVEFALNHPEASPEQQHEAWCESRREMGWTYGPQKDDVAKTHPALRPYNELPPAVQLKDHVFRAIVRACLEVEG